MNRLARAGITLVAALMAAAVTLDAASYVSRVNKGTEAYNRKEYVKAVNLLLEAERSDPSRPEAPATLGWAYYALGLFDEALGAFERSAASRETAPALSGLVFCHWRGARYEAMLAPAERWAAMAPTNPNALSALGLAALHHGEFARALGALRRATALKRDPVFEAWLAEALLGIGDYAEAGRVAERALPLEKSKYQTWQLERSRGFAAMASGDEARARTLLGGPSLGMVLSDQAGHRSLRVRWLVPGGPADRAGIRAGDTVVGYGSTHDPRDFTELVFDTLVRRAAWDEVVVLHLDREGQRVEVPVPLSRGADGGTPAITFHDDLSPASPAPPAITPSASDGLRPAGGAEGRVTALTALSVGVDPARVAQGQGFKVTTRVVATSGAKVPVVLTLQISIVQAGRTLVTTAVEQQVPAGQAWDVVKEVPRAAGAPGHYTVRVDAAAGGATARGEASLEIVAPPPTR